VIARALLAAVALLAAESAARAEAFHDLYWSPRAQAMGGAYTAVADDEAAIFYNPAGLAGIEKNTVTYASLDLQGSGDLILGFRDSRAAFTDLSPSTLNMLMGKNVYGRAQFAPTIVMPGFGLAVLVDGQAAILAQNKSLPHITLGYQNTNGVQAAYGMAIGRRKGRQGVSELRLGFAGKFLYRRGGYRLLGLMDILNVSQDTLHQVANAWKNSIGVDAGLQYVRGITSRLTLNAGLAFTDIGDTKFGLEADRIQSNLSFGLAALYRTGKMGVTLAYDYRHILQPADARKRSHFGTELNFPIFSLYAGLNQTYFSYGAGFDVWLVRVTAVSTAHEYGTFVGQNPVRTFALKAALKVGI
jgi:hypothetical protein